MRLTSSSNSAFIVVVRSCYSCICVVVVLSHRVTKYLSEAIVFSTFEGKNATILIGLNKRVLQLGYSIPASRAD